MICIARRRTLSGLRRFPAMKNPYDYGEHSLRRMMEDFLSSLTEAQRSVARQGH
ncbi:hypothetical protein [Rhizobium leguminosarum]|uniref:hypothetical protein n=1 Tax=Rhizobium leguminosarum TaxID=384 RepID=UPI0004B1E096|nr:hypothetical protein [Rhizobium leguminosarum]